MNQSAYDKLVQEKNKKSSKYYHFKNDKTDIL